MLPTTLSAFAADQITVGVSATDWTHGSTGTLRNGSGSLGNYHFEIMYIEGTGELLWCIEPGVIVGEHAPKNINTYLTTLTTAHLDMRDVPKVIGKIYQYIPDYLNPWTDMGDRAKYIAAQLLIWETVAGERDINFNWHDPHAAGYSRVTDCLGSSGVDDLIRTAYNDIVYGIQNHTLIPSFTTPDSFYLSNFTYNLTGSPPTFSLNDTHGVLANFNFSAPGFSFEVSGNTLKVTQTSNKSGTFTVNVESKTPKKVGVITYGDGNGEYDYQDVCGRLDDPVRAYFGMRIETVNCRIVKQITNETDWNTLSGFEFNVKKSDGTDIGTYTTGASGIINIPNLDPGTYVVTELEDGNFVIDSQNPQTLTIAAGEYGTVNFKNTRKMSRLTLHKENADPDMGNASMLGAKYEVRAFTYVVKGDGTNWAPGTVVGTLEYTEEMIEAGSDPYIVLPLGMYEVQETVAPKGYTLDPTEYFVNLWNGNSSGDTDFETLDGGRVVHTTLRVEEDVVLGKVTIIKSFELASPKPNVEFQMTCLSTFAPIDDNSKFDGVYRTDISGKIVVENLPLGVYRFEELRCEANEGYILAEPFDIEVIDEAYYELHPEEERADVLEYGEDVTVNIDNKYMRGKVRIIKRDDYDETPIAGAEIKISNAAGEVVGSGITDENGVLEFDNLIPGKYFVSEVTPPKNFELSSKVYEVEITEDGQVIELSFYNTMKMGYLKLAADIKNAATGEGAEIFIFAGTLLLSAAGIFLLIRKKKAKAVLRSSIAVFFIAVLCMGALAAPTQSEVTREYSDGTSISDSITEDGKMYQLSNTTQSTTSASPYTASTEKTMEYKAYTSRPNIPQSIEVSVVGADGETYNGSIPLVNSEQTRTYTVPVIATLNVIKYNLHKYAFADKVVEFADDNPDISTLHGDILAELNFSPDIYSVHGAAWSDGSYDSVVDGEDVVQRDMKITLQARVADYATYYSGDVAAGTETSPITLATYTLPPETPTIAPVEDTGLTTEQKVILAATAIGAIALVISAVLFFIAKKKKKEKPAN